MRKRIFFIQGKPMLFIFFRAYFSEEGIEYNVGRIPMAASDFSTHPYTYHDEEDKTLSNFSLAPEDYKYKVCYINTYLFDPCNVLILHMYRAFVKYMMNFLDIQGITFAKYARFLFY